MLDNFLLKLRRVESFIENYEKVKAFIENKNNITNRLPDSHSNNQYERSLGYWCHRMRQHYKNNVLSQTKISLLNNLKNWKFRCVDTFEEKCIKYNDWLVKYKKHPLRNKTDINEYQLNVFAMSMRIKNKNKILNEKQVNKLKELKIIK